MRTAKEIEQLAKDGKPLPQYADPAEEYYFDMIQAGLLKYQTKSFSKDDLLTYRNNKRRVYNHLCQQFKLNQIHNSIAIKLAQVQRDCKNTYK